MDGLNISHVSRPRSDGALFPQEQSPVVNQSMAGGIDGGEGGGGLTFCTRPREDGFLFLPERVPIANRFFLFPKGGFSIVLSYPT